MKDLTQGSITRHLVAMAVPIAIGMLFQTLYFLVDLYFVSRLGDAAIAGVSTAGHRELRDPGAHADAGRGHVALISHAVGRKDQARGEPGLQPVGAAVGALRVRDARGRVPARRPVSCGRSAPDAATAEPPASPISTGTRRAWRCSSRWWRMGSALRGTGIVQADDDWCRCSPWCSTSILAPVLIAGLGHGAPAGDRGRRTCQQHRDRRRRAAAVGVLRAPRALRGPRPAAVAPAVGDVIRRILNIGLPAGGEFFMMFIILAVIYWVIRDFGPAAQAGFGIGARVMQAMFLPVMALAFARGPGRRAELRRRATTSACARPSARRRS